MRMMSRLAAIAAMVLAMSGGATAQSKVTIAVWRLLLPRFLPTVLAEQLGEYEKAGLTVTLADFKGGSPALTAVLGGSADVVSGYFDHTVRLAAKNQALQSFVIYDQFPGFVLLVAPEPDRQDHRDQGPCRQDRRGERAGLLDRFLPEIPAAEGRAEADGRFGGRHRARRVARLPRSSAARSTRRSPSTRQ